MSSITDELRFYTQRPLPDDVALDKQNMPVIKAVSEDELDLEHLTPTNFQNIKKYENNGKKLVLNFRYDHQLNKLWDKALYYIPLITSCGAIVTPDFSVSHSMNPHWMEQYVFRNRYLGCLWQYYGVKVIPSIPWDTPDTFDVCFSGVEPGGVVCISTLGVKQNLDVFWTGYEEMKKRIHTSTIIVYGDILSEMSGRFFHIKYTDAFSQKGHPEQIPLIRMSKVFYREAL